ncbi:MAG TPA: hypothetical protein VIR27_12725 [Mycobacteriales bacterium]
MLSVMILCGLQQPASAQPLVGQIHLVVRVDPARFGDQNDLIYQVEVANLGPDRATGLVVRQSVLRCAATAPSTCKRLFAVTFPMADILPGRRNRFVVVVPLWTSDAVVVRNTVEVVRANEHDTASVLGACNDGCRPQDACASRVTELSD